VYYPLSTLILSGVRRIVLITNPKALSAHMDLLKDGSQWGIEILYAVQHTPKGIPDAFTVGREKLKAGEPTVLILGDNFFYGKDVDQNVLLGTSEQDATCFVCEVSNPSEFGVLDLDSEGNTKRIIEKPSNFISNVALSGLYKFPSDVYDKLNQIKPSGRGELEIVDLLNSYIPSSRLVTKYWSRGTAWLDTGTPRRLLEAGSFVQILQERQGLFIGSPDEVAWRLGLIDSQQLEKNVIELKGSEYGEKLLGLLNS
jgi:glucose-1-phosphate thymidylyltransferase